jgi:redox-sensitive bicupin YhaK (pirin superfamily)
MNSPIKHQVQPKAVQLGGMPVRRALPFAGQTTIGPWIFFDHFGPKEFAPLQGVDVPPHPHVNLATVTYLFDGQMLHRDSIGSTQTIEQGAMNLMVAGKGIMHSERTPEAWRQKSHRVHGIQLWHALPDSVEECAPAFHHYEAHSLPTAHSGGAEIKVLMGDAFGCQSPVVTFCHTLYLQIDFPDAASLTLPKAEQLAIYVLEGQAQVNRHALMPLQLSVFHENSSLELSAVRGTKLLVIGGEAMPPRFIEANFVASSKKRLAQAMDDWHHDRFPKVFGDPDH